MGKGDNWVNVLLLGGTGYLGCNIARALSSLGHKVICVVRRTSDISGLKDLKSVQLISNNPDQIELTFEQEDISWVVNGVCTYKPNASLYGDMLEANVLFPLSVLNLSIKHGVQNFMTMGTALPDDFNVYSFSKAKFSDFGLFLSRHDGVNFADLKLEMFYGGNFEPDNRFLKYCKTKLKSNDPLLLTKGNQRRDIIRVEDVTRLVCHLINSNYVKGYKVLPVGTGECYSIKKIVEYMKRKCNSKSKLLFGAKEIRNGEPDTLADTSWYSDIGFRVTYDFFEGLDDFCNT